MRPIARHAGLAGLVVGLAACFQPAVVPDPKTVSPPRAQEMSALALQRARGWSVGAESAPLPLVAPLPTDVDGGSRWSELEPRLVEVLAPPAPYAPFYVPTLFAAVTGVPGVSLRQVMRPMFDASMKDALQRATCLESLLAQAEWPKDLAVVLDLPGPESVAVAAQLAEHYAPVFDFDDWPHPAGVVPSHETLAATLYYAPAFERARGRRSSDAPPMFVLDENRLTPLESPSQFDNRYFAQLPTVEALKALGVSHVLYVNHDGEPELDDLTRALWDYLDHGIEVRMLGMSDFSESKDPPSEEEAAGPEDPADLWVELDPGVFFYWGGTPWAHRDFWHRLGWGYGKRAQAYAAPPVRSLGMRQLPAQRVITDHPVSAAMAWRPAARPTIYDVKKGSTPRHPPIGWIAIRTAPKNGQIVAMRAVSSAGPRGHVHAMHGPSPVAHLVSGSAARMSSAVGGGAREVHGGGVSGTHGPVSSGHASFGHASGGHSAAMHSGGIHSSGGHAGHSGGVGHASGGHR